MFRSKSKAIFNNTSVFKNSATAATPLQIFNTNARCFHATPALKLGGSDNIYTTYKNKFKRGRVNQKVDEAFIPASAVNQRNTLQSGGFGLTRTLVINNPRNLNRLDAETTQLMMQHIKMFNNDPGVQLVTLSARDKYAFSMGWDANEFLRYFQKGDLASATALVRDYNALAYYIASCDKPIASFVNGQMVGAGAALGCVTDYVMVTEQASFSSPEASYGYVPDSGNLFLMAQLEQKFPGLGFFLALTGARVEGADLIYVNLATHMANVGVEAHIIDTLKHKSSISPEITNSVVVESCVPQGAIPEFTFGKELPTIKQFFSNKKSVEEIVALLRAENSVWSNNVLGAIEQASPTAIKVTFRAMQEIVNNNLPLDAAYNLAFRAAVHMMTHPDFKEGMRAVFSEYDNAPVWSAKSLDKVDSAFVDSCITEPLSLAKHQTCDTLFPHEVWEADHVAAQFAKLQKAGKVEIF